MHRQTVWAIFYLLDDAPKARNSRAFAEYRGDGDGLLVPDVPDLSGSSLFGPFAGSLTVLSLLYREFTGKRCRFLRFWSNAARIQEIITGGYGRFP